MEKLTVAQAQRICLERGIPFYSYRLPGKKDFCFGAQLETKVELLRRIEEKKDIEGFVVVPFRESVQAPALFIRGEVVFRNFTEDKDLRNVLESAGKEREEVYKPGEETGREEYDRQVRAMISALQQDVLKKVVLARTKVLSVSAYRKAADWFEGLASKYPQAFIFLVSVPGRMTWMGATPEVFLEQLPDGLQTMALAGTRPAFTKGEWGHKEIEEQAIVTDYIASLLKTTGTWLPEGPFSKQAGGVEHLCTVFRSGKSLTGEELEHLRRLLHPTPAVGGFPTKQALDLIRRTEGESRRYYAGYIGPWHKDGTFNWYVNLRSMELFPEVVRLYIGGGITALSDPQKEWEETELKARTLLDIIGEN